MEIVWLLVIEPSHFLLVTETDWSGNSITTDTTASCCCSGKNNSELIKFHGGCYVMLEPDTVVYYMLLQVLRLWKSLPSYWIGKQK